MKTAGHKLLILLFILLMNGSDLISQEAADFIIDSYKGGSFNRTRINDVPCTLLSIGAGWRINNLIEIGGSMHTLATKVEAEWENELSRINVTMLGLDFAVVDDPYARIHTAIGLSAGMGFTSFEDNFIGDGSLDVFGYVESFGQLRWATGPTIVFCVTGGYRHVFGSGFAGIGNTDLSGYTIQLGVRLENLETFIF